MFSSDIRDEQYVLLCVIYEYSNSLQQTPITSSRLCKWWDSLLLLLHSFSILKILYLLRTSPCYRSTQLSVCDQLLRSITSAALNVDVSAESTWLQASLPVLHVGLGVRSAVTLAPSAFLASAAGCHTLTKQILRPRLHNSPALDTLDALMLWSSTTLVSPPTSPSDVHQRAWDEPQMSAIFNSLLEKVTDPVSRARLLGVSTKESGAWLNAPPVSSLGLRMVDDTVTICVGLRLRVNLCCSHPCRLCGMPVDEKALHALSCRKSQGRHPCHNSVNDIIYRSLTVAGVSG